MLYISSILTNKKVAVTDTDDNVTEYALLEDLVELTKQGIEIQGLNITESGYIYPTPVSVNTSKELVKWQMLKGIKMDINDGVLVNFQVVSKLTRDIEIRLSDYCHEIANYAMHGDRIGNDHNYHVKLILDDNLVFNKAAFANLMSTDYIIDMHEMKNGKLVERIYKALMGVYYSQFVEEKYVIDDHKRYIKNFALWAISRTRLEEKTLKTYLKTDEDVMYAHDAVIKRYKKQFVNLEGTEVHIQVSNAEVQRSSFFSQQAKSVYSSIAPNGEFVDFICSYTNLVGAHIRRLNMIIKHFTYPSCDKDIICMWDNFLMNAYRDVRFELSTKFMRYL